MDTREIILDAAARVYAQHGFRGSTTRRIADAAAVNEVTIFRYFGSKAALLQEAVQGLDVGLGSDPLPAEPVDPTAELTQWAAALVDHLSGCRSVIRKCMSELEERPEMAARATEAPTRATRELCDYFQALRNHGFTTREFDASAAAAMLIAALFHDSMGRDMMPDNYPQPAAEAPGRYAELVLRAIGVDVAPSHAAAPSGEPQSTPTI
jgi:AcrR family transcriptional regulator